MKSNADATYITNTLSYIQLLPLNEQIEDFDEILHYFNTNSEKNRSNTGYYTLVKKALAILNNHKWA